MLDHLIIGPFRKGKAVLRIRCSYGSLRFGVNLNCSWLGKIEPLSHIHDSVPPALMPAYG